MQFGFGFSFQQIAVRRASAVPIYNLMPQSEDFTSWAPTSIERITDGGVPPGFTGASQQWRDTSAVVAGRVHCALSLTLTAQNVLSWYSKMGEFFDGINNRILGSCALVTGAGTVRNLDFNQTASACTYAYSSGISAYGVGYLSNGWARSYLYLDATALGIVGQAVTGARLIPARSAADQHSAYFFGVQFEQGVATPRAYQKRP